MAQAVLPGNPPIDITLRRSPRARRISLRVSGLDGRVTLTLPRRGTEAEAMGFARQKEDWIRQQLSRQPETVDVTLGARVPVAGQMLQVAVGAGRAPRVVGARLEVPPGTVGPKVEAYVKQAARAALSAASDRYCAMLGRSYGRITLRDTRSRWGSCSSAGDLMYSWRLVLAPPEVLDYVAAHEVAHLAHMDHSPAFWAVVADLMPDYATPRGWLRREGASLHRWNFRP
ncbi:M48 family metallopeptidase [Oceaniglobus ichthyenteri]|uniref:M48 family metallopeptidase n=1 Tax=Oceaniglobus ichthyenteri TaxID=2136177 RepID=UPI000D3698D8|nr:SprT family zinc-dependent metalloprotease [Oceaniglobus ichthyenteri]